MRLLDLYCGAGGAAMGYHWAGFEVVGVDLHPQPLYPFEFHQADAIALLASPHGPVHDFDVVHASPPCQFHSAGTTIPNGSNQDRLFDPHRDYLTPTLALLAYRGVSCWIVENVPRSPMPDYSVTVCGSAFGLRVRRHRLFASSHPITGTECRHAEQGKPLGVYGHGGGQQRGATIAPRSQYPELMGMPWSDPAGAVQAIPPVYTEFLGRQLLAALEEVAV